MGQLQRLIRNYLWAGVEKERVRARVAWAVVILLETRGGLGLIDLQDQSTSLQQLFLQRTHKPSYQERVGCGRRTQDCCFYKANEPC
jgi:hypothetical protein